MTKKIFFTRAIPGNAEEIFKNKGYQVDVNKHDKMLSQEEIIEFLKKKDYDVVVTLLTDKIDAKVFEASPNTKLFANYASGFDNLDLEEAKKRGIVITNAPANETIESVAEHTIALIFATVRRIAEADKFTKAGKYKGWSPTLFIGQDIFGNKVGLIGTGKIGSRVAECMNAIGLDIIYYDVNRNEKMELLTGAKYKNNVDDVLKEADIISLHVPLMDSTYHLINKDKIALMKNGSYIINTSRGPVIEEKALIENLQNGKLAGAGLDVYEFEPEINSELLKLENVVLTPHIASASMKTREEMTEVLVKNVLEFLEGKVPENKVN
jgi:glyoxylate reductase